MITERVRRDGVFETKTIYSLDKPTNSGLPQVQVHQRVSSIHGGQVHINNVLLTIHDMASVMALLDLESSVAPDGPTDQQDTRDGSGMQPGPYSGSARRCSWCGTSYLADGDCPEPTCDRG